MSQGDKRRTVLALHVLAVDRERKILGHDEVDVHRVNARLLEVPAGLDEALIAVTLAPGNESANLRRSGHIRVT